MGGMLKSGVITIFMGVTPLLKTYTLHKGDVIFWYANQPQVLSSAGTFIFYLYVGGDSSAGIYP